MFTMAGFAALALKVLTFVGGPLLEFFNKWVDADVQKHISDNSLKGTVVGAQSNADNLNTQVRLKEGAWSPWVMVTVVGFMVPLAIHTWQVVIDTLKWHIRLGSYYLPSIVQVRASVEKLPGTFELTEHAVIQSLFVGASVGVAALITFKAMRGR